MPWTNCFLVATHISKPGTDDLDPLKVRELVQRVLG
jgi:hypothetical protein